MNETGAGSGAWAIEVEGLGKSFGNHRALTGINLKVNSGEHVTVFGPNGAGKTTLIKVLSILMKPSAGTVRLDGSDISKTPTEVRRKIGLVAHQTFLYDDLTVYENLKFYGKMYDVPNLEEQIHNVVRWVRLEARLHDRVGTLSRGMQQRISIARAVIHNPSIVLLDEPEVGLDPHAIVMVREVLDSLSAGERTVVMTTHNLEQGIEMSDRVVILDKGRIVYQEQKDRIDIATFRETYDRYTESDI
ncbi:MAG: heme ABC exporter ATP-binding protein CcmA [Dehalococcoidia bacterium]|nr:heme ABC exporter ATP-binding protein CcmA [Dehalococcoidia bacterium]MBL7166049.1 heme ABC exporter ATP-binding protein CcmA [Dehalococcoidales bacterium]